MSDYKERVDGQMIDRGTRNDLEGSVKGITQVHPGKFLEEQK
jgi:hypothetical protein